MFIAKIAAFLQACSGIMTCLFFKTWRFGTWHVQHQMSSKVPAGSGVITVAQGSDSFIRAWNGAPSLQQNKACGRNIPPKPREHHHSKKQSLKS